MADPPANDPDRLIARAIESVLESVPDVAGAEVAESESSPKSQPWAETAAPAGRNKRALDELLAEYAARVEAAPDARATLPQQPRPGEAYLERLSGGGSRRSGKRRYRGGRRRRGGGTGESGADGVSAAGGSGPSAGGGGNGGGGSGGGGGRGGRRGRGGSGRRRGG